MSVIKTEAAPYLEAFRHRSAPDEPRWLADRRRAALDRFAELGFPTRRDELWRFTNLTPLTRSVFPPATEATLTVDVAALAPYLLDGARHRIVLVNGRFASELSAIDDLPSGVWLGSTAEALAAHPDWVRAAFEESDTVGAQPLASLNGAFFVDGFVLALEPSMVLEAPIEIVHLAEADAPQAFHLRNAIAAQVGSRATVVETYAGAGIGWTNAVTRVAVGEGAHIAHVKIQAEGAGAIHTALTRASLAKSARYESFTLTTGARLSRGDSLVTLAGEGAHLNLSGTYLLRREQEATTATFVEHAALGGETREVFKGVVDDRAHGVFLGKIAVRPGADKTDAHQLNRNLLLSPRAAVDTKPELEILADDVKCSHGATVGDLDETALFYLCSRGLPMDVARRMLIEAFAADAIETAVTEPLLRAHLRRHLETWLEKRGELNLMSIVSNLRPAVQRALDSRAVRRDFPIFERNPGLVFLDSGASAQKPTAVIDGVAEFYRTDYANVHRGVYRLSAISTDRYERARESVRRFLNAADPSEIVFVRGTTEAVNLVAQSWGGAFFKPGDEVVLSELEHHSNIVPWQLIRERTGVKILAAPIDATGGLDLAAFERLLGPRTKLVAITHISNVTGHIVPVETVIRLAHGVGAKVLLDGAQAAPRLPVDVRALDADFYAFSGHKAYGPTGIGVLYAKRTLLDAMPPYQGGGTMIRTVTFEETTFLDPPQRFEAGTPDISGAIGLGIALDYIESLGREAVRDHEEALTGVAVRRLAALDGVNVVAAGQRQLGVVSFAVEGIHPHDLATVLDQHKVAVRAGHHCAQPLMERLGVGATTRASFGVYNDETDVDALVAAVEAAQKMFGG